MQDRHCDDYINDPAAPECLRRWLSYHRLAAILKRPDLHGAEPSRIQDAKRRIIPELRPHLWTDPEPTLFATFEGKPVRCLMASRFGDIGITSNLDSVRGYENRVAVSQLSNFSAESAS